MKKFALVLLLIVLSAACLSCGGGNPGELTENTFFYGITTILRFPETYMDVDISYDCFTYRLTDVDGKDYLCGVRKCSSGYGCNCGKDRIIGFILDYDGVIPEPKNQSVDTSDKTWIHVKGKLARAESETIRIYAYKADGQIDYDAAPEPVSFFHLTVSALEEIDGTGLAYYVTN